MKNGISQKDCLFFVNEEKRTVVCKIPDTEEKLLDFIEENFNFKDFHYDWALTGKGLNKMSLPRSFIGKAVCSEEDEWDEETGKMIAYSRAKDKFYKAFFVRANYFIQALDENLSNMIEIFNDMGMKLENNHLHLEKEIEERLK